MPLEDPLSPMMSSGTELIQNGKTGWLVPEGDIEAVNSIVLKMFENEDLANEVGYQGRQAAR